MNLFKVVLYIYIYINKFIFFYQYIIIVRSHYFKIVYDLIFIFNILSFIIIYHFDY